MAAYESEEDWDFDFKVKWRWEIDEEAEAKEDIKYYGEANISKENLRKYEEQVVASGGYDVDAYPGYALGLITPVSLNQEFRDSLIPCAEKCIAYFNERNNANYQVVEVLKLNVQPCAAGRLYLTFKANDAKDGKTETFQAKYYVGMPTEDCKPDEEVEECRIKPSSS